MTLKLTACREYMREATHGRFRALSYHSWWREWSA